METRPIVTIKMRQDQNGEMENKPDIVIALDPDAAPNTVKNFISLVSRGFYDGLGFHRVIPRFMIQGGCPEGNGMGGPGYGIRGEFADNGVENPLKHSRGVVSMARAGHPDSGGSQFFIMVRTIAPLDGQYAAFGEVLSGMETVDAIVNTPRDAGDKPLTPMIMDSVTVDTFGVSYEDPEIISNR